MPLPEHMFDGMKDLRSTALRKRVSVNFAEVKQAGNISCPLLVILLVIAFCICFTVEASHCATNGKFLALLHTAFLVSIHLSFIFLELSWHCGMV